MANYHHIAPLKCALTIEQIVPELSPTAIKQSVKFCIDELIKMQCEKFRSTFDSADDEIKYFKIEYPRLKSRVLFFRHVQRIMKGVPLGGKSFVLEYYEKEARDLKRFTEKHLNFISYCRSGEDHLDRVYFTREGAKQIPPTCSINHEPNFANSTGYDTLLSLYLAFEKLEDFVHWQISKLKYNTYSDPQAPKPNFTWNGSKINLVELVYALNSSGTIQGDIKTIIQTFSDLFNVDTGDYYKAFLEIKARKKSQTKFLDSLAHALMARIDEGDAI